MKMKKILTYILIAGLTLGLTTSCDKFFDSMEGDLSKVDSDALLSTENGLLALLADLYSKLPSIGISDGDKNQMFGNGARALPGYGDNVSSFWNYKTIRSVNVFLKAIEDCRASGVLDDATADHYKGEGLFLRAYYYFAMVRTLGGVPIVDEDLSVYYGTDQEDKLYVPRSTEKDTWDWVIDQFEQAAELLPETQVQEMRANKYSAYALEARVALWAASESKYWYRRPVQTSYVAYQKKLTYMEDSYADAYYGKAIAAAKKVIDNTSYKLYGENPESIKAAIENMTELFQNWKKEEGLFGRSYKTGGEDGNSSYNWASNQFVGGYTGTGVADYAVTLNLADEYDYYTDETNRARKVGTIITKADGSDKLSEYYTHPDGPEDNPGEVTADMVSSFKHYKSIDEPFLLKDARFQAWVLYPGATFRGRTYYAQGGMIRKKDGKVVVDIYPDSDNNGSGNYGVRFEGAPQSDSLWAYGGKGGDNSSFMGLTVSTNSNNRNAYCFSPRKYMDQKSSTQTVQSPYYDIRYAEVLLTYAEAVAENGSNLGDKALAKDCLNAVRHRAGFKDDVDLTIDNILHEWKVEFAFENKWSSVLYRRRGYYHKDNTEFQEEGNVGMKLTLIPLLDFSNNKEEYIFLRSAPIFGSTNHSSFGGLQGYSGTYYGSITNYVNNHIEDNNK